MRLVCQTSGNTDIEMDYATIDLTVDLAKVLLALRPIVQNVIKGTEQLGGGFYCIDLFHYEVVYGTMVDGDDSEEWIAWIESDAKEIDFASISAPVVKVMVEGVMWEAFSKYSYLPASVQTPTITWEELEEVIKGNNPFKKAGQS